MSLNAGYKNNEYSHTSEIVYFITDSSLKIHLSDGQAADAGVPDGHVMQHDAWTHSVENIGSKDLKAIIFETKCLVLLCQNVT